MKMQRILLQGGTVLLHDTNDHVEPIKTNILIEGSKIAGIGESLSVDEVEVVDCTDKIICPGFIDTHHHVWQTQLRGRHADQGFIQYMASGNLVSKVFNAADVFWGQLGGCLEMIDCGTTTVADYAHINISPEHNQNAIAATAASGLRSSYGFSPNPRLKTTVPFVIDPAGLAGHSISTLEDLAKSSPWGNGRVELGFAFDGFPYLERDSLQMLMEKLARLNISLIQTHYTWRPGMPSLPQSIEAAGYLDKRFLLAHSVGSEEDAKLLRKRDVHYSSTPSTEQQMGVGFPVGCFRDDLGVQELGSIGCDCHSINSAYIPGEARIGLQGARAARGEILASAGKIPRSASHSVEEAFNLCTIRGARAMNMADKVGSITIGKAADLVIFDANTPSMVCGAIHNPVAAIVLHSSPRDVNSVIVDGTFRKRDGQLLEIVLDEVGRSIAGLDCLAWNDVVHNLITTRTRILRELETIDLRAAEKKVLELFHMSEDMLGSP